MPFPWLPAAIMGSSLLPMLFGGDSETSAQRTSADVQQGLLDMAREKQTRQQPTEDMFMQLLNQAMGGQFTSLTAPAPTAAQSGVSDGAAYIDRVPGGRAEFDRMKARNPKWTEDDWARQHFASQRETDSRLYWGQTRPEDADGGAPTTQTGPLGGMPQLATTTLERSKQATAQGIQQAIEANARQGVTGPFAAANVARAGTAGAQGEAGAQATLIQNIIAMLPQYLGQGMTNVTNLATAGAAGAAQGAQTSVYGQQVSNQPWNALLQSLGGMDFGNIFGGGGGGTQTPTDWYSSGTSAGIMGR